MKRLLFLVLAIVFPILATQMPAAAVPKPASDEEESVPKKKSRVATTTPRPAAAKKSTANEAAPQRTSTAAGKKSPEPTTKKTERSESGAGAAEEKAKSPSPPSRKKSTSSEDTSSAKKSAGADGKPLGDGNAEKTEHASKRVGADETTSAKDSAAGAPAKTSAIIDPAAPPPEKVPSAANASITSSDLVEFDAQPDRVKKLIEAALALTRQNLTYIYGSADPADGGMDCSGFIYYVLRSQGFAHVPRAANEQYIWVRKADEFDAVLSKKKQSFELDALQPGDLLFWTGTYTTERDPPVTHTMIYLGVERDSKQRVMAGSSDGRTYRGKARWGVSVFDFQGGQTSKDRAKAGRGGFAGYATIPGLR